MTLFRSPGLKKPMRLRRGRRAEGGNGKQNGRCYRCAEKRCRTESKVSPWLLRRRAKTYALQPTVNFLALSVLERAVGVFLSLLLVWGFCSILSSMQRSLRRRKRRETTAKRNVQCHCLEFVFPADRVKQFAIATVQYLPQEPTPLPQPPKADVLLHTPGRCMFFHGRGAIRYRGVASYRPCGICMESEGLSSIALCARVRCFLPRSQHV